MAKKIAKTTRTSPKQRLAEYKLAALNFIARLKNPNQYPAFNVATYEKTPTGKKPNFLSAPELGAIVGTARQLGKSVQISLSGSGDEARLYFSYVDSQLTTPLELL